MLFAIAALIPLAMAGPVIKRQAVYDDVLPDVPVGSVYYDPPKGYGRTLRAYGRPDLCLTVQTGQAAGVPNVELSYCFDANDEYLADWAKLQDWNITNPASGPIKLQNTEYCLDAGNNPSPGDYISLQRCGNNPDGNNGQNWDFPSEDYLQGPNSQSYNNRFRDGICWGNGTENIDLCLAIDANSHKLRTGPYDIQKLLWMQPCNATGNSRDNLQIFVNSGYPQ